MCPEHVNGVTSFHNLVESFVQNIKKSNSTNPEALPRRTGADSRDNNYQSRIDNGKYCIKCKNDFIKKELCLTADIKYSGLYFYFDRYNKDYPISYIGKAIDLYNRIKKHFLDFDCFFYSAAFPQNYDQYYSDCIKYYADKYGRTKLDRQFAAFKLTPFKEIGWISSDELKDDSILKIVENNAIFFYCPKANGTKGNMQGNQISEKIFEKIKLTISCWLTHEPISCAIQELNF